VSERPPPAAVVLEGDRARAYCALATRLLEVARAGGHFPEPQPLRQLFWGASHAWPRAPEARVEVVAATGFPSLRTLEQLALLRRTAVEYFDSHGAKPRADSRAFLTALAGSPLPERTSTVARLVSRAKGGRRFQVVHELYAGHFGLPVRFTFHLTDEKQRYLSAGRDGQATVSKALHQALEACCEGGAEEALWGLAALEGTQVAEVVMGQLGPLEAPGFFVAPQAPLAKFLPSGGSDAAVLHLVVERAASDVAADGCRDPFGRLAEGPQVERRRAALGYRVFRERRLACTEALQAPLQQHLASLGAPLVLRSR
jgi:hypothetical protein